MPQQTVEKLLERNKKAQANALLWHDLYDSAKSLAMPQRNLFTKTDRGADRMAGIYDSTGIRSTNNFVNTMQSSLTPPFMQWAKLIAGVAIGEDQKQEVNKSLEVITETMFAIMNASNFNTAVSEFYYDLAVGTAAMLILEGNEERPINYIAVPIEQLALEEGAFGQIGAIFRKHKLPAHIVEKQWKNVKLNAELQRMINDKPTDKIEFLEITYEEEDDAGKKTWYYEVIHEDTKHKIVEQRFVTSNPWVISRWSKTPQEIWGRGVLLQALPDLKLLNKAKELTIKTAQLNAFGVYTVADDGVVNPNTLRILPAGFIPVGRNGGANGPSIAPLPRSGDPNLQELMLGDLKIAIEEMLLNKQLPPMQGGVRSATEIIERLKEGQNTIGSAYGRQMYEFIQPLLQRTLDILTRRGLIQLPEPIKIDNFFVSIQIESPIAKAQNLDKVNSLVQALQILGSVDPQLLGLSYKIEEIGTVIGEYLGVDAELIRTKQEREEIQENAAQVAQAQMQAQLQQQQQ